MMTIHEAIQYYKSNIERYWNNENYKWAAVAWFTSKWNENADDFASMLEESLKYADNLLQGGNYYPKSTLCALAKVKSEEVKALFVQLFDESKELANRIKSFQSGCDELLTYLRENIPGNSKALNHYQDLRAICVYLSFRYPQKYFLYKAQMYSKFKKLVAYTETSTEKDPMMRKYENFARLCQSVIEEVKNDDELITMQSQRVNEDKTYYPDHNFHLLAQTIIWVFPNIKDEMDYWPSKEEYDPGITTEKWVDLLTDPTVTSKSNLEMFSMIMDYGMPATCTQLAKMYKRDKNYFNKGSSSYAEKVAKKISCALPPDKESNAKWWPILYVGRTSKDDEDGTYVWKLRDELKAALEQIELPEIQEKTEADVVTNMVEHDHNIILYGPPGTGKTYHTVTYAVAIIEGCSLDEIKAEEYSAIKARYNEYYGKGQIRFVTFHQSYGYEEFIEGIRPVMDETMEDGSTDVKYKVVDGAFKTFCTSALLPPKSDNSLTKEYGFNSSPSVWKVSLFGTGNNPVREECLANGHIRIGWDFYGENVTDETDFSARGGRNVLNAFNNLMRVGDVVLSCFSSSSIDAIGVIEGEYEWHPEYDSYRRLRKVRWLAKGLNYNIVEMNEGSTMTLSTVYRLKVSIADVLKILREVTPKNTGLNNQERFVFVIDEINRGNISKVFGELITLIEPSKRSGQLEEMTLDLPYSGKPFSIPNNVYILGTMNTADRSIAMMDTALRRRFRFVEMQPDPSVLKDVEVKGIDVSEMLRVMNKRIEILYDREHTIGHSYFIPLKKTPTMECLSGIFKRNIIPLLQEYFFDDFQKIRLVLADNQKPEGLQFVARNVEEVSSLFGTAEADEYDLRGGYCIHEDVLDNKPEAYISIYNC